MWKWDPSLSLPTLEALAWHCKYLIKASNKVRKLDPNAYIELVIEKAGFDEDVYIIA